MNFIKGLAIVFVQYLLGVTIAALVLSAWVVVPAVMEAFK